MIRSDNGTNLTFNDLKTALLELNNSEIDTF